MLLSCLLIKNISIYSRSSEFDCIEITSLDVVFTENEKDEVADASDSDGYLSEFLHLIPFIYLFYHSA